MSVTDAPAPVESSLSAQQDGPHPRTHRMTELLLIVIAVAISAGAYVLVGLGTTDSIPGNVYEYTIWLACLGLGLHAVVWWRAKYADPVLVPVAILLNGIGLAMIFRLDQASKTSVATNQLIWMTLGCILAALVVIFLRDHRILRRWIYISGLAAIAMLLLPLVPGLGHTVLGARIWIHVGPFSFQPGEVAKLLLAVFFAGYLVNYRDQLALAGGKFLGVRLPRLRDTGPIAIAWVASVGILVFQRDLGTSLLFFGLFVAMLYVATGVKSWIFIGTLLFAGGAYVAYLMFDHVQQRVNGWLHALDPAEFNKTPGGSYQLVQGMFGMGNGGLFGTGLGQGRPQIVPFANSDFIFASLGEELGLIGVFAILALYLIFFERGMKTALMLRDGFGTLLAAGIAFTFAFQTFIVVGGVTRVIPLTGLTTPFLAAGGSSLIANWIIVGLLLRMSDNARRPVAEIPTGVLPVLKVDADEPRRTHTTAAEPVEDEWATGDDISLPTSAGSVHGRRRSRGAPSPAVHSDDEALTAAVSQSAETNDAMPSTAAASGDGDETQALSPDDAPTSARPAVRSRNRLAGEDQ